VLYVFGYTLGWFPTSGGYEEATPGWNWAFIQEAVSHAFLPALALLIVTPIGWILGMRNTMVLNLGEDYIRLAKAKGLPDRSVALKYAARNALLPSVTGFALALGGVLGGAILVETVFDYPGLGRLMGEAVTQKDYPLLQALMLMSAVGVLVANLAADLLYGVLDPRARRAEG
jgi:peptide/nickel transport system permease protein